MIDDGAGRAGRLAAPAILVLAVALFHARGLWPGHTFLPVDLANNSLPWLEGSPMPLQNWLVSDPLFQSYPFLAHAVDATRRGEELWWNPYLFTGHPTVADPLAQPFYPAFLVLGLLFGAARGLALGLGLHVALAAFFTYGLLRSIRCSIPASVLGALTYALSGYMVTWLEMSFWTSTLTWFPAALWGLEATLRRHSLRPALLGAVAVALSFLGGQISFAALFLPFLGLYGLGRSLELALGRKGGWAWPLGISLGIGALGALLSAVQLLPFLEFLGMSHRASPGPRDPLPLLQLVTLVVPSFYGNPTTGVYWGEMNFSEGTIYTGLPALLPALAAPFWARRFFVSYLALAAVILLDLATGGPGAEVAAMPPGLQYASLHRLLFLLPLLVAMLAALALSRSDGAAPAVLVAATFLGAAVGLALYLDPDRTQQHWGQLRAPLLRAGGLLAASTLLLLALGRFRQWRSRLEWALVLLLFLDLYSFGHRFNPAGPVARLMPPTPLVEYLRANVGSHRVAVYQLDEQLLFGPNVLSLFDIAEGGGYSSLAPARFQQLVGIADPKGDARGVGYWLRGNGNIVFFDQPSERLLELLGVGFVVSPLLLEDPPGREVYQGEAFVYQLPTLPRARVVHAAEYLPEDMGAIRRLLDRAFDLRSAAVVADPLSLPAEVETPPTPATLVSYRNTEVVVDATTSRAGLLVLGDQYHPGWQVYLDGQPASLYRVNLVQRGVLLPPGEHRVVFRFLPDSLKTGALLSLVGVILMALLDRFVDGVGRRGGRGESSPAPASAAASGGGRRAASRGARPAARP